MINPHSQVPSESPDSLARGFQSGSPARAPWTRRHLLLLPTRTATTGIWSNWSRRDRRWLYVYVETRHTHTHTQTLEPLSSPLIEDVVPDDTIIRRLFGTVPGGKHNDCCKLDAHDGACTPARLRCRVRNPRANSKIDPVRL